MRYILDKSNNKSVIFIIFGLLVSPLVWNACSSSTTKSANPKQQENKVCSATPGHAAGDQLVEIDVDGRKRTFNVHVPTGYVQNQTHPVVLSFHGGRGDGESQATISQIRAKADAEKFISVEPDGLGQSWNAGVCCDYAYDNAIDDVEFVRKILDHLEAEYCIDTSRIYATGLSNGGRFVHRLGCQLSDRLAAIAPIAAPITHKDPVTLEVAFECAPAQPISIFQFHGMKDICNPYNGGTTGGGSVQERHNISIPDTVEIWKTANGCSNQKTTHVVTPNMSCDVYEECSAQASLQICVHAEAGHAWPGGVPYNLWNLCGGEWSTDFSLTDAIWDFFKNIEK